MLLETLWRLNCCSLQVFCSMNQKLKEQNKGIFSRFGFCHVRYFVLLDFSYSNCLGISSLHPSGYRFFSLLNSHCPPFFSPGQNKEVRGL